MREAIQGEARVWTGWGKEAFAMKDRRFQVLGKMLSSMLMVGEITVVLRIISQG